MDSFPRTVVFRSVFVCALVGTMLPHVQGVLKMFVKEGDDIMLPCSSKPKVNIGQMLFDWKCDNKEVFLFNKGEYYGNGLLGQDKDFKGRVSHFVEELQHGNASILIRNVKTTDTGNFTCVFPHLVPRQTSRVELFVELTFKNRLGEIEGAASPPYVNILNTTGDGVLLQCLVRGAFPKPQVEWQTSDGSVFPAEEPLVSQRGDVVLLATVNKTTTNIFRCVVKQDGFGHVVDNELYVPDILFEDKSEDKSCHSTSVMIVSIVINVILLIVIGTLITMNRRKGDVKADATKAGCDFTKQDQSKREFSLLVENNNQSNGKLTTAL